MSKVRIEKHTTDWAIETLFSSEPPEQSIRIGDITNYYGSLIVCEQDNKYYWTIEDWDGCYWEEIGKELYHDLVSKKGQK